MAVGTAVRETEHYLEAIERLNPKLNAVLTVTADMALEQARGRCGGGKREWLGILHGVPMLVKGCLNVTGVRTTFGTSLYRDHISNSGSAVVEHARKCGPVFLGKTNLAEFYYEATTQTTHNISRNNTALGYAGLPGLTVPCGFNSAGLPIGMQLVGTWFGEPLAFRAGVAYQSRTEFHRMRPKLSA